MLPFAPMRGDCTPQPGHLLPVLLLLLLAFLFIIICEEGSASVLLERSDQL